MTLTTYRRKRQFERTPEPEGTSERSGGPLRFVVQKHQASRLHYDFRLELEGTLKSWAVPKGPSLNPEDKRLAIMVEDHPLDYRTFEGIIPQGNYGAGTVMVWDEGTYHVPESSERTQSERVLTHGLQKGHLRFVLHGTKLQGEFSLVKLRKGESNSWLLVKKRDECASEEDVKAKDRSVISQRTMEEIAGTTSKKGTGPLSGGKSNTIDLRDVRKAEMPHLVKPMLATFVEESFDRAGWLFELKLDGYRAIAEVEPKSALLYSRNHNSYEERFRPVVESLRRLGHRAVLDGEVVVVDAAGKPQFQLLQNYQKTGRGRLVYYVFDLLYLDGHDLRGLPLKRRKEILQQVLPDLPAVKFNEHVEERGTAFFQAVAEHGLEGVIAKNAASPYREGLRSRNWLKIKTHLRQQAVIAGYTKPRGSRKNLGALVLGVYDGEALVYIGHAGGGFAETTLADVYAKLRPLAQDKCPFVKRPKTNAPVQWVRPELVCEVTFQAWTQDGQMRQPIFLGLRQDEPARSVRRERPAATAEILSGREDKAKEGTRKMVSVEGHAAVNQHRPPFGDKAVPLTHLDKVYWPQERYTKGDLIAYYRDIGSFIFPYLKDRPQSLHRHPNGIEGNSFFQKDMSRQRHPDWVKTVRLSSESKGEEITYFVCTDERSLLYLANLGCIELNPWHSRIGTLDRPDYLVIDLDPENVPFDRLVKTAQAVRKLLDQIEAEGYCKTSGKRGLHIYVPLAGRYDYDLARRFAEVIANLVHRQFPEFTSIIRSPALRQQRVYLDYLQNGRGKTLAAPYSVRPVRNATVSTPLKWSEVRKGLDPAKFTILSMRKRLDKIGDVWEPVLGPGVDLEKCLERISRMFKEQRR